MALRDKDAAERVVEALKAAPNKETRKVIADRKDRKSRRN